MKTQIEWIPIKVRSLTFEERENWYDEQEGWNDEECRLTWDCPMPNDGEEVLITLINGLIDMTRFGDDCFEDYDYFEITAWASLPEPYRSEE